MKNTLSYLLILVLLLTCTGCAKGDVSDVQRIIMPSEQYTKGEIEDAMDIAITYFRKHFEGCTLLTMEYDQSKTLSAEYANAAQFDAEEAIVLLSSFTVDENGGDGSFNPNSTYTRWQWILTRNGRGAWELKTWGYG